MFFGQYCGIATFSDLHRQGWGKVAYVLTYHGVANMELHARLTLRIRNIAEHSTVDITTPLKF